LYKAVADTVNNLL